MTLTQIALSTFVAVAAGGLLMVAIMVLRIRIPALLSTGHGLAGLLALALLFAANLRGGEATAEAAWWALGFLLSGFTGGLLLFRVVFRDRATLPLVAMHASLGVFGIYLLYRVAL